MWSFVDAAPLETVRELAAWGVLDDATNNPTPIARCARTCGEVVRRLAESVDRPASQR